MVWVGRDLRDHVRERVLVLGADRALLFQD